MSSIAVRRTRAWGILGAVLAILVGLGLVASPAFAAGPVYVVHGDVATSSSTPPATGWVADWSPVDWDIRDDGLHISLDEQGGAEFEYVLNGQRYSDLASLMTFLEGSSITITEGELQWMCIEVELTMPILPTASPMPTATGNPSSPPEAGSTVSVLLCLSDDPTGVGVADFTTIDTWAMCAGSISPTSDVFDSYNNCYPEYTLEQLFGLLTSFSPAVGIQSLRFGTEGPDEAVVTRVVFGNDFRFTAAPDPDTDPELAATGPEITAPAIAGGVLLLVGFGALALVAMLRPRRR